MIKAYMAESKGAKLQLAEYDPGPLGADEVEIQVGYCGLCQIAPLVEEMPMSRINDAFALLKNGAPRYRIVLKSDFQQHH